MIKHAAYSCAVIVALVCALLMVWVTLGRAHDTEVVACFVHAPVTRVHNSVHPTGLWAEGYDHTGDGKTDVMTLSPITGYEYDWSKDHDQDVTVLHQDHPLLYVIDTNHDYKPDLAYVDKVGNGVCDEMELYEYFGTEDDKEARHGDRTDGADERG